LIDRAGDDLRQADIEALGPSLAVVRAARLGQMLPYIHEHGTAQRGQIARYVDINVYQARTALEESLASDHIIRVGQGRAIGYVATG
jgi:hypothetical protein